MVKYIYYFIFCILIGIVIFGYITQGAKNTAYKTDITELEREREELAETITELRTDITELENERNELEEINRENREIIRRFENENNTLRKNLTGFGEDIEELEKLLSEFLVD